MQIARTPTPHIDDDQGENRDRGGHRMIVDILLPRVTWWRFFHAQSSRGTTIACLIGAALLVGRRKNTLPNNTIPHQTINTKKRPQELYIVLGLLLLSCPPPLHRPLVRLCFLFHRTSTPPPPPYCSFLYDPWSQGFHPPSPPRCMPYTFTASTLTPRRLPLACSYVRIPGVLRSDINILQKTKKICTSTVVAYICVFVSIVSEQITQKQPIFLIELATHAAAGAPFFSLLRCSP